MFIYTEELVNSRDPIPNNRQKKPYLSSTLHSPELSADDGGHNHQRGRDENHDDTQRRKPAPEAVVREAQNLNRQDLGSRPREDHGQGQLAHELAGHEYPSRDNARNEEGDDDAAHGRQGARPADQGRLLQM